MARRANSAIQKIFRAVGLLPKGGLWGATLTLLALGLVVSAGTFSRYFLKSPLTFVDELGGYAMVVVVFLAVGYVARIDGHIRVDLVLTYLPAKLRAAMVRVGFGLSAIWTIALVIGMWNRVHYYYVEDFHSTTMAIPLWIPSAVILAGCIMLLVQVIMLVAHGSTHEGKKEN